MAVVPFIFRGRIIGEWIEGLPENQREDVGYLFWTNQNIQNSSVATGAKALLIMMILAVVWIIYMTMTFDPLSTSAHTVHAPQNQLLGTIILLTICAVPLSLWYLLGLFIDWKFYKPTREKLKTELKTTFSANPCRWNIALGRLRQAFPLIAEEIDKIVGNV